MSEPESAARAGPAQDQTSPATPFSLRERVALVTGAGRGLGLAMARSLAEAGALTYINGRSAPALQAAAGALRADGVDVRASVFDVADTSAALAALSHLHEEHGRLDVLVNNVGARLRRPAADISALEFIHLLEVDLVAAFELSKAAAAKMAATGYGRIIMVSSIASLLAPSADAAYAAAKGGLNALARALACEFGPHGVTCNVLCPGVFGTESNAAVLADPRRASAIAARTPLRRVARPEEIGPACLFLAAPASSFVTGATLVVDGGITAAVGM